MVRSRSPVQVWPSAQSLLLFKVFSDRITSEITKFKMQSVKCKMINQKWEVRGGKWEVFEN